MAAATEIERGEQTWSGLDGLQPTLRKFLHTRCRDGHEVDDIVQETLLRAARYRGGLLERERLRPWVLRIAANVYRDRVHRARRLPAVELDEDLMQSDRSDAADPASRHDGIWFEIDGEAVEREMALAILGESFERLADHDRAVLRSFYAGGGSCAETARECGLHPALAKVRLFRARRRLRARVRARLSRMRTERLVHSE